MCVQLELKLLSIAYRVMNVSQGMMGFSRGDERVGLRLKYLIFASIRVNLLHNS